jgi:Flp pilus assembly pilin Flp
MKKILHDQRGQTFIEVLLYILVFCLVVATFVSPLAQAVGSKFTDMTDRINQIGS